MLGNDVKLLRERLGFSEDEMAKRIGLSLARYLAVESGTERVIRLHTLALERLALGVAAERKEPELAPTAVRRIALRYASIVLDQSRPPIE